MRSCGLGWLLLNCLMPAVAEVGEQLSAFLLLMLKRYEAAYGEDYRELIPILVSNWWNERAATAGEPETL